MPYISKSRREDLAKGNPVITAGELNYTITKLIMDIWQQDNCYQTANDIIGALEGAKLEFYRRVVTPYENQKCIENGDVYV
jgi:hypothetical protein